MESWGNTFFTRQVTAIFPTFINYKKPNLTGAILLNLAEEELIPTFGG